MSNPTITKITIPGYTLLKLLSEGDYAYVYKGTRDKDPVSVIIKTLKNKYPTQETIARFKQEYHLLELAGTMPIIDASFQGNNYIIMEDDNSRPLKTMLVKPFSIDQFFEIGSGIIKCLEIIHSHHIVHKDINPSNILWNKNTRQVRIIDFGLSTLLTTEETNFDNFQENNGMLEYISPEQTGRMNRPIDYRTDFYSLGITFYEMLTGQTPFKNDDILELIHAHLTKIPESIIKLNPKVPPILAAVVNKLMAKMPEERYSSITGLKADFTECLKQWHKNKKIESFSLGEEDIQEHLIVSQKLYGRETQSIEILTIFDRVSTKSNELLFVTGYSGIGKTSLVRELYKPITRQHGIFVSGKFDQLKHSIPFSAFTEAFNELIHRLLTEPENELIILKLKIKEIVGPYGELIKNTIPNINLLIGQPSPMPLLEPGDVEEKLMSLLQEIITILAQPKHPLVIFVDDLQWADLPSLKLIKEFLLNKELKHFLLIGAYRDNEVDISHPLTLIQEDLDKKEIHFNTIKLPPLKLDDVYHLLANSLRSPGSQTLLLANLIFDKTRGNPFFINQFLTLLYKDKLLVFSYKSHQWEWDMQKISEQTITDNVVDTLISRIKLLPNESRELLQLASCIGHVFDLRGLSVITRKPINELNQYLWELLNDSFIVPANKNYQMAGELSDMDMANDIAEKIEYYFIHDRIQQAAYQLIPDNVKEETHLKIGYLLLKEKALHEDDKWLLDVIPHLNRSSSLITEDAEIKQLAEYNLWAGKNVVKSAAYELGKEFFEKGIKLLQKYPTDEVHQLNFELYKELATCLFLTGNPNEAEKIYNNLLKTAKGKLSIFELAYLTCKINFILNKGGEAFKVVLDVLKMVDINIPMNPTRLTVIKHLIKIRWLIGRRKLQEMNLPPMTSEEYKAVTRLIGVLIDNSLFVDPLIFLILNLINIEISLKHGFTERVIYSYLVYANIMFHRLHNPKRGLEVFTLIKTLSKQIHTPEARMQMNAFLNIGIDPWNKPFEKIKEEFLECYSWFEKCNLTLANLTLMCLLLVEWMLGKSLTDIKISLEKVHHFKTKTQGILFAQLIKINEYTLKSLSSESYHVDELNSLIKEEIELNSNKLGQLACRISVVKLCYFLNEFENSIKQGAILNRQKKSFVAFFYNAEGCFYYALSLVASKMNNSYKKNDTNIMREFNDVYAFISNWAELYPPNFELYKHILLAEKANIEQKPIEAMKYYQAAITKAEEMNNLCIVAVANECASRFYLNNNLPSIAKGYLTSANKAYIAWGANEKAISIRKQYPEFFAEENQPVVIGKTKSDTGTALASIDVLSLMRATQIISEEIQLDRLLQNLLIILLQNAGADYGILITKEDNDKWYVRAQGTVTAQDITLTRIKPIDERSDLPLSLIRYVQRTSEPLVIQDEKALETFLPDDVFLQNNQKKSIIVIPIIHKNLISGLLYLENNSIMHAFTSENIHILKVLASQAAISIENAQLYYQATHDPLTGLANRNLLYQVFKITSNQADHKRSKIAIMYYDLDSFKKINDSFGHGIGDKLLYFIGEQINLSLRASDLAARLGGDEFVSMLVDITPAEVKKIANRFLDKLKRKVHIDGHDINIGCSIGVSFYPDDSNDIAELLKCADIALYKVKSSGKGSCQFYTTKMDEEISNDGINEESLRQAVANHDLEIYYQPIYSSHNHKIVRIEALLRWHHLTMGLLNASEFIAIAESSGLILPIGNWVLLSVIRQIRSWLDNNLPIVPVALNISGLQLGKHRLSNIISKLLTDYRIDSKYLVLEFTESSFIDTNNKVTKDIEKIHELGIVLTLDDFGTYYSSLTYLRRFSIDHIKIDKTFIKNLSSNEKDRKLVLGIIAIARNLKLKITAEGVEDSKQLEFLEENGVDEIQGFYLSEAVTSKECMELLVNQKVISKR